MNFSFLGNFWVSSKRFAAAILLTSGTLAWYFLIQFNIGLVFTEFAGLLFYVFSAVSAIAGSLISRKADKRLFILSWIALGVLSTGLLTLFSYQSSFTPFLGILMGLSLGTGLPTSMAFIADSTLIEERARVSGITIFVTFILAIFAMITASFLSFDRSTSILFFALVRSISFLALFLEKFDAEDRTQEEYRLPKAEYKDLILYIAPWLMFIFVSMLAWYLIPPEYGAARDIGQILRFACIAGFGFLSGLIADRFGRKPVIIIGLIVLGLSFAILGQGLSDTSVIIYLTASGVAWGSFFAMYLVIPGDLSISGSREKFFVLITVLPLLLVGTTPFIPGLEDLIYSSAFSQILSLVLFISIIPVLRAKETLPDFKIRERRLKRHIEKVGKIISESKKRSKQKK